MTVLAIFIAGVVIHLALSFTDHPCLAVAVAVAVILYGLWLLGEKLGESGEDWS